MKTYSFDVLFTDPRSYTNKPLRFQQEADNIIEAWEKVTQFEVTVWGEDLVSITYMGIAEPSMSLSWPG
jgi:hypothetical protein